MDEKRKYQRLQSQALLEISNPGFGTIELKGKDLSDGGAFALLGNHIAPPIGTLLKVRIKRNTGLINVEPTDMRVVHHQDGGIGLMFV